MTSFSGVDAQLCRTAFNHIVKPAIDSAYDAGILNKLAGCLVVLDPAVPYEPKYRNAIEDAVFDELVLWRHHFGNPREHELSKYIGIAQAKALDTYLTGLPSHQIQQVLPSLFLPGMTKWGGSAVRGVGPVRLITAFSGVQWYFDQMIAEMMISAIEALCHDRVKVLMASDEVMIPPRADD